jgi:hypothetical protein
LRGALCPKSVRDDGGIARGKIATAPHMARAASEALSANGAEQDEQSRGVMLLGDILRVFDGRLKGGKAADRVS